MIKKNKQRIVKITKRNERIVSKSNKKNNEKMK